MAQSNKMGRKALGLKPFWDKPSSNLSISWEKWRSRLKMALVAKTNIELDELLQGRPTTVIYPRTGSRATRTESNTNNGKRTNVEVPPGNSQMKKRM